jgi:hypothetical protein
MTTRKMIDRLDSDELPNLLLRYKQVRCKTQKTVQNMILKPEQAQKKEKTNSEKDLQETDCHDANFIQLSLLEAYGSRGG